MADLLDASLRIEVGDNQETSSIRQSQSDWQTEEKDRGITVVLIPRVSHGATHVAPLQGTQAASQVHFFQAPKPTIDPRARPTSDEKYENS